MLVAEGGFGLVTGVATQKRLYVDKLQCVNEYYRLSSFKVSVDIENIYMILAWTVSFKIQ